MIKQAIEIFVAAGRGYNLRDIKGHAWTPEAARAICERYPDEAVETAVINLIRIGDNWHRVHVIPFPHAGIEGDPEAASNSRIESGDFPDAVTPAVYIELQGRKNVRLPHRIEKILGYIERLPKETECRLYTMRRGAPICPSFHVWELYEKEDVQKAVWEWINNEHKVRQK